MSAATTARAAPAWPEANQRHLMAAVDEVRTALRRHAERVGAEATEPASAEPGSTSAEPGSRAALGPGPEPADPTVIAGTMDRPPALDRLCRAFGLSDFERAVLLLCAGIELDAAFAGLCAAAGSPHPTFGLALAALPGAHWSALAPTAPLRHWRLIEVRAGDTLSRSPLRVDERVLHHLAGVQHLDENLVGFAQPVPPHDGEPVPSYRALADRVAGAWARADAGEPAPVVQLCGGEVAGKRVLAAAACDRVGLRLYRMPASVLPSGSHELDALLRLWSREAVLSHAALLLDAEDVDAADAAHAARVRRFAHEVGGPLIIAARERVDLPHRPSLAFDVARPTRSEQKALWVETLGPHAARLNGAVDRVSSQFDLAAPGIRAAALRVLGVLDGLLPSAAGAGTSDADGTGEEGARGASHDRAETALWEACRTQARQSLEGHARVVEPRATWADLILPGPQLDTLRAIEAHVRHRLTVHEDWGFAARTARGLGITALFSGTSGTGKTLAAEVLAHALGLDLYHVDLSAVVSKYIGETEKNLRRVFDAAEAGGAVLLFDEADALFGKRSEVKDSHDRYANLEVSYLLQRMESYRGLAILTTNLKSALDPAFERRLRFRVAFPFPDAPGRAAIWRRIFPPETPTEGLDPDRLARLDATGGTIHNVALHAAFLAAADGEPVRMTHVRDAARSVYAQLEKPLTGRELEEWT
jgi:hypothetical protein